MTRHHGPRNGVRYPAALPCLVGSLLILLMGCGADDASTSVSDVGSPVDAAASEANDAPTGGGVPDVEQPTDGPAETDTPLQDSDPGGGDPDTTGMIDTNAPVDTGPVDAGPAPIPCTPKRAQHTVNIDDLIAVAAQSCAGGGCHVGGGEAAGLQLDAPVFYANTVGVKAKNSKLMRIHPGEPALSYLYGKLTGQATFSQMPLGAPPLPEASIAMFREWIEDCARPDAIVGAPTAP